MIYFRGRGARGSVAIMALWVLVTLALLAIGLSQGVRQKITVAEHLRAREELRAAAEGAVKKTICDIQSAGHSLGETATGNEWYAGILGRNLSFTAGRASANFMIEDESSKINLNKANSYILTNLFRYALRLDPEQAERLTDALIDFRDGDDFVRGDGQGGGSEKGAYRQAGLPLPPKNGDLEFIGELRRVHGITKEIYSFVENYITIYGDGRVNVNTCGKEILYAIGIAPGLADKIIRVRDAKGSKGPEGANFVYTDVSKIVETLAKYYVLSPVEEESLNHALAQSELCVTSHVFKISGRTRIPGQSVTGRFFCVYTAGKGIEYWAET